jgi:hypothetical protein
MEMEDRRGKGNIIKCMKYGNRNTKGEEEMEDKEGEVTKK